MMIKRQLGLAALSLPLCASAQLAVRDSDSEAKNAYQETCTASQVIPGFARCNMPALPFDKRLALRYASATCREKGGTTRNISITFATRLTGSLGSATAGPVLSPRRINTAQPFHLLAEPIYAHADAPPQIIVTWEGDGELSCITSVYGFLHDLR